VILGQRGSSDRFTADEHLAHNRIVLRSTDMFIEIDAGGQ
jgi:hypothetical protein